MIKLSIVIPVYNEYRAIDSVCTNIKQILHNIKAKYEIIIVDDGSNNKTKEILKSLKSNKGIKIIEHPYNIGYGAALKTGINSAQYETILMLDGDGTYPIESIPKLLQYADKYHIVTGARVGKGVKIPLLRKPAKWILNKLANFMVGKRLPDINCGMRIIKKSNVMKYYNILPQKFSFTITHLLACLSNGETVKFIKIPYHHRKGKSTIHPIKDFLRFNSIILRVITYFNPFKIFTLISAILLAIAIIIFYYSFFILGKLMDVTIILIVLSSLQIFLFGLIADLIVKKTKM